MRPPWPSPCPIPPVPRQGSQLSEPLNPSTALPRIPHPHFTTPPKRSPEHTFCGLLYCPVLTPSFILVLTLSYPLIHVLFIPEVQRRLPFLANTISIASHYYHPPLRLNTTSTVKRTLVLTKPSPFLQGQQLHWPPPHIVFERVHFDTDKKRQSDPHSEELAGIDLSSRAFRRSTVHIEQDT